MDVDCTKVQSLNGADQLFCLLKDPFKASVSHRRTFHLHSLLTSTGSFKPMPFGSPWVLP